MRNKKIQSYEGVALVCPVTYAYQKADDSHSAPWYLGSVLRELINKAGIDKAEVDGFAISSFSLGHVGLNSCPMEAVLVLSHYAVLLARYRQATQMWSPVLVETLLDIVRLK